MQFVCTYELQRRRITLLIVPENFNSCVHTSCNSFPLMASSLSIYFNSCVHTSCNIFKLVSDLSNSYFNSCVHTSCNIVTLWLNSFSSDFNSCVHTSCNCKNVQKSTTITHAYCNLCTFDYVINICSA